MLMNTMVNKKRIIWKQIHVFQFKMTTVFATSDGSTYKTVSAAWLADKEIWKGNRVIDMDHVDRIREGINGNITLLDGNPYRLAFIRQEDGTEKPYIIDGQHRAFLLKEHFSISGKPDFNVLVAGKHFNNEDEVIDYFKMVNNTRSIAWKEDPVLCANAYIAAMMKVFNKDPKHPLLRSGKTSRPFMSVDKLREALLQRKVQDWKTKPFHYAENCREQNNSMVEGLKIKEKLSTMETRALNYGFALALDDKFSWL